MAKIEAAIEAGRCALAVSGALTHDAEVMLALKERAALMPMVMSGPATDPLLPVGDAGLARAIGQPGGVLVLVEPGPADMAAVTRLGQLVATAPHKPAVIVVAKKYDAFPMMAAFRGTRLEHVKDRAKAFLAALPLPPALEEAPLPDVPKASERRKGTDGASVQPPFVGREEPLAELVGMLGQGGPIVVSGPRGIGRATLVEHALGAAGVARVAELKLGRPAGFDALIAILAEACREAGAPALAERLSAGVEERPTPPELVALAVSTLQAAEGLDGKAIVVHGLHFAAGKDGSFFRKSRLELLCEALLTATYPLRLVFVSAIQPVFFREGRDAPLRRLELGGILGRFYHEVFTGYGVEGVARDKFGPLSERLHGNPLAVLTAAVAVRHTPKLADDDKFFSLSGADDEEGIGKQIAKRLAKLDDTLRGALSWCAHLRDPVDGAALGDLGITRKYREALVAEGLLSVLGPSDQRRYRVHDLVRRQLTAREVASFDILDELGARARKAFETASGVARVVIALDANRAAHGARKANLAVDAGFPDHDALLDGIAGLLRGTRARPDLAAERIAYVLKRDPANADAHLLKLELLRRTDAKNEDVAAAIDEAVAKAPVPEVFHEAVGFHLARNARNKAIKVLEDAVAAFPDQARLRTRLGSLLLRQGRRPEAIEHFQEAMRLDPMLPDAYGLLGMARRDEGPARLDEAETLLREAVRLAPGDVVQSSRLVGLLLEIFRGVPERREAVRGEIKSILDGLYAADKQSFDVLVLFAETLRTLGDDLERALWFLKTARKHLPKRRGAGIRLDLEFALLDLSRGDLDRAEPALRRLAKSEPSNHRVFLAIADVLVARRQFVAAHAELKRAADRTAPDSLDRAVIDGRLAEVAGMIAAEAEALAAGLPSPFGPASASVVESAEPAPSEAPAAAEDAPEAEAASADDDEAPVSASDDDEAPYAASDDDVSGGDDEVAHAASEGEPSAGTTSPGEEPGGDEGAREG